MITFPKNYPDNVFINCPFDSSYNHLFEAIIFTVHDCGFIARCAREEDDSGNVRIRKIMKIIDDCKYGIHDISKADLDIHTKLARFNMPLELGIFMGAHQYSSKAHYNKEKRSLVLDIEQYRYQQFISDLAGQDISSHNGQPDQVILSVRNFLYTNTKRKSIASGQYIFERFNVFLSGLPGYCATLHWDRNNLVFLAYATCVTEWIKSNKY